MTNKSATLAGECSPWPTRQALVSYLRNAGLTVNEGQHSIRIEDFGHFIFQHYSGDLSEPLIDADADSLETLLQDAKLVSEALATAGVRHRFELYHNRNLAAYLHHNWAAEA